ncbi:beta strand repeat-containing protein [Lacinutrix himadriensis]|uniref:beta strand repeat-containing protein n=1 Tax=Lacinutrix himadriensis TaxID=641549 RepID=UPI0006E23AF5|nr:hypothetical protein [Lacinutrix himadriensis]
METLTSIALNPDNTNIDYTDEDGVTTQLDLSAIIANLEVLTTLVDNNDGTLTYTDEDGNPTVLDVANLETLTSIALNTDNTNIDYTDEDGVTTQLDLSAIVANLEALTTLVDNNDGTLTYTDENGAQTIINAANLETLTTLTNNGDLTYTYLNEAGTPVVISVIDNDNDSTNELQDLFLNGTELQLSNPATPGNLVDLTSQITLEMFADAPNPNSEIYWNGTQWVYGTRVVSVNNSVPDPSGNINIPIGNVYTGPTTSTGDIGVIEVGGTPQEGDIYVVNSDAPDPAQVGATYIYDNDSSDWIAIDPFNAALYDPRYVNISGDTMVGNLDMNGNTVTDLGAPTGPSDATPKSYVDAIGLVDNGDGTFSLQKPDGAIDTVSKATLTANLDGTYTFDNNDGNPIIIDISALETLTSIALNTDNINIDYVDENGITTQLNLSAIVANLEALTTLVDNNDGTLTYTDEDGNPTILNVANLETLTSIALNPDNTNIDYTDEDGVATQINLSALVNNLETVTTITDNTNGTFTYVDENGSATVISITDNDNDATNEITTVTDNGNGTTTITDVNGGNVTLDNDGIDNVDDADNDATNEIQTVESTDGSVAITANGNDFDLSVTPFDETGLQTQITTNTNDIDTLEAEQLTQNDAIADNATAITDHITADEDIDATNEIQTVESTDGSVAITANGNDFDLSVTPFDETGLQTQITTNADDIDTLEAEQVTQNDAIADNASDITDNTTAITDHITADEDIDATNEIQTVESTDGSVAITANGNDFDLSVTPFDETGLQSQITTNAGDIDTLEAEQVTQNDAIADNASDIVNNATASQIILRQMKIEQE